MSIFPPALKKGDTIGVFAPSSRVDPAEIEKSKKVIESNGFKVFIHPQTFEQEHQSAGSHLQKSLAFQGLWQRDDIKAIWAAGGGNRCLHLLETINFKKMSANPKILIGFSDVTALLNAVYAHANITALHGPVFKNLYKYKELDHLIDLLEGGKPPYPINTNNIFKAGKALGKLVGGNLSIFQYLPQTLPSEFWKDAVLFLEDCNEELSRIDRMLLHLKRLDVLNDIQGLILGQFTDMKDTGTPFGYKFEDILSEHTEDSGFPILIDMPFGHGDQLYSFPIGVEVTIDTEKPLLELKTPALTL